jgi:DNA-binding beta-propeller fold protein YncE
MRAATEVGAARFAAVVLTPVGEPQAAGLAIPDTYVDNGRFGTVSVINTSTDKVAKRWARHRAIRTLNTRGD